MINIPLTRGGRIVITKTVVDIYHQDPIPVFNFTSVDNHEEITTLSSGNLVTGTFPTSGIDLFNSNLGGFGSLNILTSGIQRYTSVFDIQYKRVNIPISGTKNVGRI